MSVAGRAAGNAALHVRAFRPRQYRQAQTFPLQSLRSIVASMIPHTHKYRGWVLAPFHHLWPLLKLSLAPSSRPNPRRPLRSAASRFA
jgi:hypothetical protein